MKLKILIAGVAVFCVIVAPAAAVVKCVKLTQSSTCTSTTANNSSPEWTATCGGTPIKGIGICSDKKGSSVGSKSSSLTIDYYTDENKYCWCKIISPAVSSQWTYDDYNYTSGADCARDCAYGCAADIETNAALRSSLLYGFSD